MKMIYITIGVEPAAAMGDSRGDEQRRVVTCFATERGEEENRGVMTEWRTKIGHAPSACLMRKSGFGINKLLPKVDD